MHAVTRGALVLLALSAVSPGAQASDCAKPDLLEAYPDYYETPPLVPGNATLTAHYAPTAQYLGEDVLFDDGTGNPVALAATFDDTEGLLQVTPGALVGSRQYTVKWPRLAGISTASRGRGRDVTFVASPDDDRTAPSFAGLAKIEWDVRRERDDCTDNLEDRFSFELFPGPVSDDFPTEHLALFVFQTAGPHVDPAAAPAPISIQHLPPAGSPTKLSLSIGEAAGHVCFAAFVKDLAGRVSTGAEHEVCTHTTRPPFFYGCRFSGTRSSPSPVAPLLLASILVLSLVARRGHRATP